MADQLIDAGAIAAMLGVSRQHVTDRLTKRPTFPPPAIDLSQRLRRWDRAAVMAWLAQSEGATAPAFLVLQNSACAPDFRVIH